MKKAICLLSALAAFAVASPMAMAKPSAKVGTVQTLRGLGRAKAKTPGVTKRHRRAKRSMHSKRKVKSGAQQAPQLPSKKKI